MKRIFFLATSVCLLFLLPGCSYFNIVRGNGELIDEQIEIGDYDQIVLAGPAAEVRYTQSDSTPSLQIKTDRNIYEMFEFKVEDSTLQIIQKEDYKKLHLFPTEFAVNTSSKNLRIVNLTGKSEFSLIDTIRTDQLEVTLTGSSTFTADYLQGGKLSGTITGSGTFHIKGKADQASFIITGRGNVNAFDMQTDQLDCIITGKGNMDVWVTKNLKAILVGMGKIKYKGDPEISKEVRGIGSVKKAG